MANYYLKVKPANKISDEEFAVVVSVLESQTNPPRKLTEGEKATVRENANLDKNRIGTLELIEHLVTVYSPHMKEFKNQLAFNRLIDKFRNHDSTKYNYLELTNDEHGLLVRLMEHDNYVNRLSNGQEFPLKDIAHVLSLVVDMPNVKPLDYEKK